MATYDNKVWLLKNIRDAFIATDDTGLCEIVMAGEDFSKIFQNKALEEKKKIREGKLSQPSTSKCKEQGMGDISEEDERENVTQFDPYPDMEDSEDDDMCSYIRYDENRTNTAQLLEKKELALKKAAKIKVIKWEDSSPLTKEQIYETFNKAEIKKPEKLKSLLTEQLQNCPDLPHLHYLEYAKFDGTARTGVRTKSFKIFMSLVSEKQQNNPLVVCIIANAKIKELIGLICYKYSIEHPDCSLGPVHEYGLCIAEDDGEVDLAFSCLDSNEPCSKFGFTCLGLIELKKKIAGPPGYGPEDMQGPFQNNIISVFNGRNDSGQSLQNPSRHNTGGSGTSEAVISALQSVNREKMAAQDSDIDIIQSHMMATDASQYKAYRVSLPRKVIKNLNVQLSISIDKIEVEPLVGHKHVFWTKAKYSRHSIDSVAWCQILEGKGHRATFRIVYSEGPDLSCSDRNSSGNSSFLNPNPAYKYKAHEFECNYDTAREIVEKINTILDLRNSPCHREYKIAKEKKQQVRRSFNNKQNISFTNS